MDNNALLDLDMNALDGDVNWEGWDDLVKDFQMEVDNQPDRVGPTLGGWGVVVICIRSSTDLELDIREGLAGWMRNCRSIGTGL